MIGVVIVSHSARLAEGVCELANQVAQGRVPLAAAGGVDDPQNPIGTDATLVLQAIESVYSDDGVIVLMDLGSAVLSAELAIELLPEVRRSAVRLCAAPLVEGAVAAVGQILAGSALEQVVSEADRALLAKSAHLHASPAEGAAPPVLTAPPTREVVLTIPNELGIHARPAARFVTVASRYRAQISVRNVTRNIGPLSGASINQVLLLGARQGHQVAIAAEGLDADEALAALSALIHDGFGEDGRRSNLTPALSRGEREKEEKRARRAAGETRARPGGTLRGIAASPGIAIGPLRVWRAARIAVTARQASDPEAEAQRLREAIQAVQEELGALRAHAVARFGEAAAAIFEAHKLFLDDPTLVEAALGLIRQQHASAAWAWQSAIDAVVARYRSLDDSYLQARAADLADVGQRVLQRLAGVAAEPPALPEPGVLAVADLTPSECEHLDPGVVLGICAELGSPNAHSAILVRALGIPMIVDLGPAILDITDGTPVAMDGARGKVWVSPDAAAVSALEAQRAAWRGAWQAARAASHEPGHTRDGRRVGVMANIRSLGDVRLALDCGAEGIGLLRTESFYLGRAAPPSEEEQCALYREMAEALGPRPLVVRTLDIGGDKPLPYLQAQGAREEGEREANPFLGWRGIRLALGRPEMLATQFRAILRASPGHTLRILLPMISTLAEVREAKALLEASKDTLRWAGAAFDERIELGAMVEVPSAAVLADRLAAEVGFLSIGSNDLCQYVLAADRTNARVAALADPFHPAVLRLIQQTIRSAHSAGIRVALCGELAGDPMAAPLLLGMGLDEFSMNPPAIPPLKQTLATLAMPDAAAIVSAALVLDSGQAVRQVVSERFPELRTLGA